MLNSEINSAAPPADMSGNRLRILVISVGLPKMDIASGDRRLFALLKMLASRHDVDFCSTYNELKKMPGANSTRYRDMLHGIGVRVIESDWRTVPAALAQNRYDLAFLEFFHVAAKYASLLRVSQPGIKIIVDSVDVHFAREGTGAALGVEDASQIERKKQQEIATYRAADAVVSVSTPDHALLEQLEGMPPLYLLPNIIPLRAREQQVRPPSCIFIGGFVHPPNVDGLRWLCEAIWPRIRERVPEARLMVIGSGATPEIKAMADQPGIDFLGYVEDTAPYLDQAAISIAPLRYGAGMKGKVTEALAYGVPVVTTSFGAQGLEIVNGREMRLAEDAPGFAEAVIDLLRNPEEAARMGLRGQEYIAGICSPERVGETLHRMVTEVVGASQPHNRTLEQLRWRASALAFAGMNAVGTKLKR